MPNLTRRSLLVLGGTGAAGLAVAGCGTEDDPRAEGSDDELLGRAASAEAALGALYDGLDAGPQGNPAVEAFRDASSSRQDELSKLGASEGGAAAESGATAADVIEAASAAIAAYREGVRLFSTTELRAAATQFLTAVSSEQAVLRGVEGEDQSPSPFVTGLEEKPYVASEDDDDNDADSSTTSTTSTSTSTSTTSTTTEDGG